MFKVRCFKRGVDGYFCHRTIAYTEVPPQPARFARKVYLGRDTAALRKLDEALIEWYALPWYRRKALPFLKRWRVQQPSPWNFGYNPYER